MQSVELVGPIRYTNGMRANERDLESMTREALALEGFEHVGNTIRNGVVTSEHYAHEDGEASLTVYVTREATLATRRAS